MRIGLVSDNHRLVDAAALRVVAGVDEVWHAGDFVDDAMLDVLEAQGPLVAVRGNNDVSGRVAALPEERVFVREGWTIHLRHVLDASARADLVMCGHSHRPLVEQRDDVAIINPGSCGPRRFRLPRTAGTLELFAHEARVQLIDLDTGATLVDERLRR